MFIFFYYSLYYDFFSRVLVKHYKLFLCYLNQVRGVTGPHIVIVPKSTLGNWMREFAKWCPMIRAVKLHGAKADRKVIMETKLQPGMFDVIVTSYEVVIIEKAFLNKVRKKEKEKQEIKKSKTNKN